MFERFAEEEKQNKFCQLYRTLCSDYQTLGWFIVLRQWGVYCGLVPISRSAAPRKDHSSPEILTHWDREVPDIKDEHWNRIWPNSLTTPPPSLLKLFNQKKDGFHSVPKLRCILKIYLLSEQIENVLFGSFMIIATSSKCVRQRKLREFWCLLPIFWMEMSRSWNKNLPKLHQQYIFLLIQSVKML